MITTTDFVPGVDDREVRIMHSRVNARNALDRTADHLEWLACHDHPATRPAWARAAELLRDVEAHGLPRPDSPMPPPSAPRSTLRLITRA